MGQLLDLCGVPRYAHGVPAGAPLVPLETGTAPTWRLERLNENRFRLTIVASGLDDAEVDVWIDGGLLRVEDAGRLDFACAFLLLEPLAITRIATGENEIVIELGRDHAWPCLAVPPPRRRENVAALALAA